MGATSSCGAVDGPLDRKKLEEYQVGRATSLKELTSRICRVELHLFHAKGDKEVRIPQMNLQGKRPLYTHRIFAKFKRFMENWNPEKNATKDRLPHSKMTQFLPELEVKIRQKKRILYYTYHDDSLE